MEKPAETRVIFEDDDLLVIDKPAGVVVNESETTRDQTLQSWLINFFHLPAGERGIGDRAGIVHRLDRDTSGVLIVAKNQASFEALQKQFKERKVSKEYLALVHGQVEAKGEINAPIGRNPKNRYKFDVVAGAREASTSWVRDSFYKTNEDFFKNLHAKYAPSFKKDYQTFSLIRVHPKTGRTHQIRVHMRYLGHALVSDDLYTGRKFFSLDRIWCPRVFLHASTITFTHPTTNKKVTFEAPLPSELKKSLDNLVKVV